MHVNACRMEAMEKPEARPPVDGAMKTAALPSQYDDLGSLPGSRAGYSMAIPRAVPQWMSERLPIALVGRGSPRRLMLLRLYEPEKTSDNLIQDHDHLE